MPLVRVTKAKRPRTNYRGRRPTKGRDAALNDQMEQAFSASWAKGVRRVKGNVSTQKMADAYFDKSYAGVMLDVPFDDFNDYLADAIKNLATATGAGGERAARLVPDIGELNYDLRNPRIVDYLESRAGALISGVTDDFQVSVQDMLKERFGEGVSTGQMREQVGSLLRSSIGLDRVSAGALRNAAKSGKYDDAGLRAYEDRLFTRRADNIARTEVAFATNEGQLAVWDASAEQGLISAQSQKVWVAEANPCPDCLPMDGIMVGLDEEFLAPSGVTVRSPPLHVNCRCAMQLQVDEDADVPGSNVQNYGEDA